MNHRYLTFIKAINLTFDYLSLNVAMVLAYYFEGRENVFFIDNVSYLPIVLVFNFTWLLSANLTGLYEKVLNKDSIRTYRNVFRTYVIFICIICFIVIIVGPKTYFITRSYLLYSSVLFGVLLATWKLIFLAIRKSDRARLYDSRNVVIIGSGRVGIDLQHYFENNSGLGYNLVGFFDDNPNNITNKQMYLGSTKESISYVLNNRVDEIFCALPVSEKSKIEQLMSDADKNLIRFRFVPEYYDYGIKPVLIQSFGNIPVISVRPEPLENMLNRFFKRVFDILFALFVIVFFFSWLFPILAILIRLESKGPIFFTQQRSGRDNNPFMCYKFRSMKVNDESDKRQATRDDNRITKVGAFIRRTSIDELPQFFNVIIGNMSVVGPRPHMISHTKQYSELIDSFMIRQFLKPGITGWAQVKGLRGETKTTEAMLKRVEADVWYLENWSFLLDMKIIFLTVWNSTKGDENAF